MVPTVLVDAVPDIEFGANHIVFIDACGARRAYPRNVAIQTFARFAEGLRESRLERGADILPFRQEFPAAHN